MVNPITLEKVVGCTTAVSRLKEPAQEVISYTPFPFTSPMQIVVSLVHAGFLEYGIRHKSIKDCPKMFSEERESRNI